MNKFFFFISFLIYFSFGNIAYANSLGKEVNTLGKISNSICEGRYVREPSFYSEEKGLKEFVYNRYSKNNESGIKPFIPMDNGLLDKGDLEKQNNKGLSKSIQKFTLPYSEGFENGLGGLQQSHDDDYDWLIISGSQSANHPYGAYEGMYYCYTEAPNSYDYNKEYGLYGLFSFKDINKPLLSFWYYKSVTSSELKVQVSTDGGLSWITKLNCPGTNSPFWQNAMVGLYDYANDTSVLVRIWGVTGGSLTYGRLAIDLVELYNNVEAPENLESSLIFNTGQVNLTWDYDNSKSFEYFNIYRDSILIASTTDESFSEILNTYGVYEYKVTAYHNDGESSPTNVKVIDYNLETPTVLQAQINENIGTVNLNWNLGVLDPVYSIYENFEDGVANNWNPVNGIWQVISNSYYKAQLNSYFCSSYFDNDFSAYEYEVKMRKTTGTSASIGLYFNGDPSGTTSGWNNGYSISYETEGFWKVSRTVDGAWESLQSKAHSSAINTGLGAWNVLKVIVADYHFDVYINDMLVGTFYDETFSSGKVGVSLFDYNSNGTAEYDYITLHELTESYVFGKFPNEDLNNNKNGSSLSQNSLRNPNKKSMLPNPLEKGQYTFEGKGTKSFQYYNIYRNDSIIDTSIDTSYTEALNSYGEYRYKITANYNEGESNPSNIDTVVYSSISINVDSINFGLLNSGEEITLPFIMTNTGNVEVNGMVEAPDGFTVGYAPYTIPPNSSITVNVTFIPEGTKMYDDEIVIYHNAFGDNKTLIVTGEGNLEYFVLPYCESFEDGFGGWVQSIDDDSDWSREDGKTVSYNTGPSSAYDGLFYLYTEPNGNYDKEFGLYGMLSFANIGSPYMSFRFHMFGNDMGNLKVQVSIDDGAIWNDELILVGNHGNQWHHAGIDLSDYAYDTSLLVRFMGITAGDQSDMAIDMVEFYNNLQAPSNLTSSLDQGTGEVLLNWEYDFAKEFQEFHIYRNSSLVGICSDTTFVDNLITYGTNEYVIRVLHEDGESPPTNMETLFWSYTDYSANPSALSVDVVSGGNATLPFTITDNGGNGLNYNIGIECFSKNKSDSILSISKVEELIIKRSNISNCDIEIKGYDFSEKKEVRNVISKPEDIIHTEYSGLKGALAVAVLGAEYYTDKLINVQYSLLGTNKFSSVTYINLSAITPNLAELQAFDAVLIWSATEYKDNILLGDILADYVDGGGGVVSAIFEVANSFYDPYYFLLGRWKEGKYYVLNRTLKGSAYGECMGQYDPNHPIMSSVNSFCGEIQPFSSSYSPGASWVAKWNNGRPLVAIKDVGICHRVDLGFYPVTTELSNYGWDASTDGALIMANSLEWTVGERWLSVDPQSGIIDKNESVSINVKFDASELNPGVYTANLRVMNVMHSYVDIPVTLNVLHPFSVDVSAILEGPFFGNQMIPLLNIYHYIPLSQPYSAMPWNYPGGESVAAIPSIDVIDWVLVEIRETSGDASTATEGTVIGRRAGFLLKDGSIVDVDGNSPLVFSSLVSQNIYAVIYHRNHLPVMSASPLIPTGNLYSFDFTTGESQVYGGTYGHTELFKGIWGLFSGNAFPDKNIDNKDKNDVWNVEKGSQGYYNGDMNMDGQVDISDEHLNWKDNSAKSSTVPE